MSKLILVFLRSKKIIVKAPPDLTSCSTSIHIDHRISFYILRCYVLSQFIFYPSLTNRCSGQKNF